MARFLSLSQAARMVKVPRRALQRQIQQGVLSTFEGSLLMEELLRIYPNANADESGMLEKTRLLKEAAFGKVLTETRLDPEHLSAELQRARVKLVRMQEELDKHQKLAVDLQRRLFHLQDQCDKREARLLGTLIAWFTNELKKQVRVR